MSTARGLIFLCKLSAKALGAASNKLEEKGVYKAIGKGVNKTINTSIKLSKAASQHGKDSMFMHERRHVIKKFKDNPDLTFGELTPQECFQWGECVVRFTEDLDELEVALELFLNAGKQGHIKAQEEAIKLKERIQLFYK